MLTGDWQAIDSGKLGLWCFDQEPGQPYPGNLVGASTALLDDQADLPCLPRAN
jgi:hypothetical protein